MDLLNEGIMATEKLPLHWSPSTRLRATPAILAIALLVLTLSGCGRPEFRTEPLEEYELERIAATIADHWGDPASMRASGSGRLSTSNSMTRFSFAVLYDDPSWIRVDVRPTAVITGPIGNLHFQMDGICSEAYLPGLPLWIQGCLGDEWDALDEIDLPALMLGFLTPRTLLSIDRPEVGETEGLTVIAGLVGERTIAFTLTDDLRELVRVEIADGDGNETIEIDYVGHGWKKGTPAPRTVTLVHDSQDTRPQELKVLFTRLKHGPPVDREALSIAVPPGLSAVSWDELKLWR